MTQQVLPLVKSSLTILEFDRLFGILAAGVSREMISLRAVCCSLPLMRPGSKYVEGLPAPCVRVHMCVRVCGYVYVCMCVYEQVC